MGWSPKYLQNIASQIEQKSKYDQWSHGVATGNMAAN